MTEKAQSVRVHHPFDETMDRHFATMENALYAAEIACSDLDEKQIAECCGCIWEAKDGIHCRMKMIRELVGERKIGGRLS